MIADHRDQQAALLSRWELPLVALLSPLLAFPPLGRPLIWLALLLPAFWLAAAARGADLLPRTPLNGSLLLLLVAVCLSLTASFDLLFSAPKVLGLVLGLAAFFAIVRRVDDERALFAAADSFAVAGAALALVGLLGTSWIGKIPLLATITSRLPAVIRGVPGASEGFQPNAVAGALIMFIPLQLALVIAGGPRFRALRVAATLFSLAVLVLTQSRNGWMSLFVALAAWSIWQPRGRRRWRVAATVGVIVIVAAAVVINVREIAEQQLGQGIRGDVISRTELWSRAIMAIHDFPFTGVGMNNFRRVMPVLYPVASMAPDVDIAHAHNHLLHAGAELGLVGLVGYLALWLGIAALLFTTIRSSLRWQTRWLAGGLAAAFVASFMFGMADTIALGAKIGLFFWVALALAVCGHRNTSEALP